MPFKCFEGLTEACSPAHFVAESIFFLFKIGEALLEPSIRLYIYQAVCIQEFPNDTTCINLHKFPESENKVQRLAAGYFMGYKLILNLPVVFVGLFCGAWSDRVGRKMPVILSSFGTIVAVLFFLTSMITDSRGVPLLPLVFAGAAVRGLFGKSAIMTMALHSHVSDISSEETRTRKLGKLLSMNYFGYFVGSLLAGAVLEGAGFEVIFCLVIVFNCMCVFVTVLFMKESVPVCKSDSSVALFAFDPDHQQLQSADERPRSKCRIPFRWKLLKESVDVLVRSRPSRRLILFMFSTIFVQQTCKSGEVDITLLFTEKSPLLWRRSLYGYLLATDYALLGVASAVLLPCLIRFLRLDDMTLVIVGVVFKTARLLVIAFSTETWMVFMSVAVGCPSALIISCAKSLISKSVDEDEMGKTFSLLSCGETFSSFLGSIIFTSVYQATVSVFPGLVFAADAMVFVVLLLALLVLACDLKRAEKNDERQLIGDDVEERQKDYGSVKGLTLEASPEESEEKVEELKPSRAASSLPGTVESLPTNDKVASRATATGDFKLDPSSSEETASRDAETGTKDVAIRNDNSSDENNASPMQNDLIQDTNVDSDPPSKRQ